LERTCDAGVAWRLGEFDRSTRQLGADIIVETGMQPHLDPPLSLRHAWVNIRMNIPIKKSLKIREAGSLDAPTCSIGREFSRREE
jgi:hypothetical protein